MDKPKQNDNNDEGRLAKKIKNFIYHPTDVIGSGFSSKVYKGVNEFQMDPNRRTIAVKVIQLAKVQNQVQKYLFNNQVNALKSIKHPNVLNTIDILMTKNNVYIITQYCEGGDLLKHIKKEGTFSGLDGLKIISNIIEGYICIEEMKIIHRDLKTANIFLKNGIAKIADFGFCEFIGDKKPQIAYNVGSPAYMSPESYKQNQYSSKSDIWGIGIILYEILVGETPDKNLTYTEMATNLMNGKIKQIQNQEIKRILTLCFKKNLNERITAKNLLQLVNAQINHLHSFQQRKQSGNKIENSHSNNMLSSVPPTLPSSQPLRDTRLYSPAKRKQIHFNRAENAPQRISSSQLSQNQGSSRKITHTNQVMNSKLKSQTEMLLFLYRLLKFLGTQASNQRLAQTHIILFRHRNLVDSLVESHNFNEKYDEYNEYVYLRSRFDEVYLQTVRENHNHHHYQQKLQKFANIHFLSPDALRLYKQIIKEGCSECISIFQTRPQTINWNQLGVILDYLMIQFQILSLHSEGKSFENVVKEAQVDSIIRQQPKKVTDTHVLLLKHKFHKLISDSEPRINPFIPQKRVIQHRHTTQYPSSFPFIS